MQVSAVLILISAMVLAGCRAAAKQAGAAATGGDPAHGVTAISRYGCGSCHTIPGVAGAHGQVGPPLSGIANRLYVAGMLQNTPDNLVHWVRHPRQVNEKTVMPELGLTQQEAVDVAAYLYSLK
jgi:cytochrome c